MFPGFSPGTCEQEKARLQRACVYFYDRQNKKIRNNLVFSSCNYNFACYISIASRIDNLKSRKKTAELIRGRYKCNAIRWIVADAVYAETIYWGSI